MRIIPAALTLILTMALLPSSGFPDASIQRPKATNPSLHTSKKPVKG
jgi:hypothetical protein